MINKLFRNKDIQNPLSFQTKSPTKEVRIHVTKESLKAKIVPITEAPFITRLKIIDNENNEVYLEEELLILVNDKVFVKPKNILIMDFLNGEIKSILSNKSSLCIQHIFNERFIIDQFVSSRSIELYFNYKLDNMHISFLVWKGRTNNIKKQIEKDNTNIFTVSANFEIDLTNLDTQISPETKDMFATYPYINFNQICDCSTFRDVFESLNSIYSKTRDLNYIKSINYLSKLAYQHMNSQDN